ncbi:MAG TPA: protein kinase [Terriglobales bacterium]|nr:protein kinase [Terriglobales bacterium]
MPIASGTKLGPYEIQSELGAGGMGEVYRARDTRLDRQVAIKVLAGHLSSSPELKQRMEREARAISSLNHPHICQLYDIGSQDGTDYLVMEFLEGETVGERLRKGALPLNEALKVGAEVAEALEVAHRAGIVHRDLKPANIMLTKSGAKLMDFGLAKPFGMSPSASGAAPAFTAVATMTGLSPASPLTTAGSIVGTIQYMSPEQIEGKEADARSDIFALGAVLYEMATGKRAFEGKSQISVASSILEKDPDPISAAKPMTPSAFEYVVKTCLQKNPEDRFQSAHDVRLQIKWIAEDRPSPAAPASVPASRHRSERLAWAAAVLIAIVGALAVGTFMNRPPQPRTIRTVIAPPEGSSFRLTGDLAGPPVLSPDGAYVAFSAAASSDGKVALWVRPMDKLDARVLPGTENVTFPFWSPDSQSLGFFADGKLKTIDLNGGSPQVVCDVPQGRGGAWGADGTILLTTDVQAPLSRVSASGGAPVAVTKIDHARHTSHRWPFFLPDGKHFLYLALNHDSAQSQNDAIYFASLDGAENRPLFRSLSNAIYADGFVLFARGSQLMAQKLDPSSGKLSGATQILANGVANDLSTWHMDASASGAGLLVMGNGGAPEWELIWLDRTGKRIGVVADKLSNLQFAHLSPQGDRVVLQIDTGANDIWVLDLARGIRTRLTFGPVWNAYPVWSPDGKWIAYASQRNGRQHLYRRLSNGSGAEELLLEDDQTLFPTDWSSDGKYLLYARGPLSAKGQEVWALPFEGDRKPFLVVPRGENSFATEAALSPDGRWLAYTSNESGQTEVYVVPFRGGQGKWQVSQNGGDVPIWGKDGKSLYYANLSFTVFAVPVNSQNDTLEFGTPEQLASNLSSQMFFYDVAPDGKKLLLNTISEQVNQSIAVVTNWSQELKK